VRDSLFANARCFEAEFDQSPVKHLLTLIRMATPQTGECERMSGTCQLGHPPKFFRGRHSRVEGIHEANDIGRRIVIGATAHAEV